MLHPPKEDVHGSRDGELNGYASRVTTNVTLLFDDDRLSVGMGVYITAEYYRGGINTRWQPVWLPKLEKTLTACDDLNCYELWA